MELEPRRRTRLQARATAIAPALVFPARGARVRRVENVVGSSHASFSVEDYLSCEDPLQPSGSYDYVQTDDSVDGEIKETKMIKLFSLKQQKKDGTDQGARSTKGHRRRQQRSYEYQKILMS